MPTRRARQGELACTLNRARSSRRHTAQADTSAQCMLWGCSLRRTANPREACSGTPAAHTGLAGVFAGTASLLAGLS